MRAPRIPLGAPEPALGRLLTGLTTHYTASVNIDAAAGPVVHNSHYPKGSPPFAAQRMGRPPPDRWYFPGRFVLQSYAGDSAAGEAEEGLPGARAIR